MRYLVNSWHTYATNPQTSFRSQTTQTIDQPKILTFNLETLKATHRMICIVAWRARTHRPPYRLMNFRRLLSDSRFEIVMDKPGATLDNAARRTPKLRSAISTVMSECSVGPRHTIDRLVFDPDE